VGEGQLATVVAPDRLRVLPGAAAGGRVAHVADRHVALQRAQLLLVEDLGDEAGVAHRRDVAALAGGDPGRLLTAVLQRVEAEVGEAGDVVAGRVYAEDAAFLARRIAIYRLPLGRSQSACFLALEKDVTRRQTAYSGRVAAGAACKPATAERSGASSPAAANARSSRTRFEQTAAAGNVAAVNVRAHWYSPATLLALGALIAAIVYTPADKGPADLAISKTDAPDPVLVGGTLTYTIQVANLGPQSASKVKVTDRLPGKVGFVSAVASSGSCKGKGNKVSCDLGTIAADPTKANAVTVTIQVRPTKAGTITNAATVDGAGADPVKANNRAQASTTVTALPQVSSCRGVAATITGTKRADRLVGTGGPDVIAGLGGDDTIFSFAGRDLVCSGGGGDQVTGGSASDRVFGSGGADRLRGRRGRDLLAGGAGADLLAGNAGRDRLRGGSGADHCIGGPGLDRLRGCES
jgi:uncharacterized repeat protein (TIGR01451 family)